MTEPRHGGPAVGGHADPSFDRFARIVRDVLDVPVALVSFVEPHRQVFAGAVGLGEPWQTTRETPLSHSFCQYVVADDAPLVISDSRLEPRLTGNRAIDVLNVIAYAGYPIRDGDGRAVGSLCAIDSEPRTWGDEQLRILADLAVVCSTELALRDSQADLVRAVRTATDLSTRARTLLALSESLSETNTVGEIAAALQDIATKVLNCRYAGVWLLDDHGDSLTYVHHSSVVWEAARILPPLSADASNPLGSPLVDGLSLFFRDTAEQDVSFPGFAARPGLQRTEAEARVFVPLTIGGRTLGTLLLLWAGPHEFTDEDRISISALASYSSQAIHRAHLLAERTSVASIMQSALLTELPQPDSLKLAARYRTATEHDEVGGDWYDAVVMPAGHTNIVIGDVTGHDINAAARMGALRNMLRALSWAFDDTPADSVTRLDRMIRDLRLHTMASLVLARIEQDEAARARDVRVLRWSNAGHPPPLLVHLDGRCDILDDGRPANCLIGVDPSTARRDQTVEIPLGSTLVLYTDGLIETREETLDDGIARLRESLVAHRHRPVEHLLDAMLADLVGERRLDDIAVLAVRFD